MKKSLNTVVFFSLLIVPVLLNAQLNHFIYFQTEGKQPFYAKLDKKIFSSSATGYLIIPKLKDGSYNITIGFPKNEHGEQNYVCNIDSKDVGYLVKNFGDKGWGLFNLQTLDVVMAGNRQAEEKVARVEKTDEFSNMLSDVVNDPSIRQVEKPVTETQKELANKEFVKQEPPGPLKTNEISENTSNSIQQPKTVAGNEKVSKPVIIKKQVFSGENGTEITYVDITGDGQDTIQLFIPLDKEVPGKEEAVEKLTALQSDEKINDSNNNNAVSNLDTQKSNQHVVTTSSNGAFVKDTVALAKQEVNAAKDLKAEKQEDGDKEKGKEFLPVEISTGNIPSAASPMVNSDCKVYATDEDFLKIRKKMAAADNTDEMILVAKKFSKSKCYSTEQVKNLSVLLLNNAEKYRFFDLAYQYVFDSQNFSILEGELSEPYYKNRFKAMLRH